MSAYAPAVVAFRNSRRDRILNVEEFLRLQGAAQAKFAASFVSPAPLYFAICGYGQSGREIGEFAFVAIIDAGGVPCSIQRSIAVSASNRSGPVPPPQWSTPGARNRRTLSLAAGTFSRTRSKYSIVDSGLGPGSLNPCHSRSFPPRP